MASLALTVNQSCGFWSIDSTGLHSDEAMQLQQVAINVIENMRSVTSYTEMQMLSIMNENQYVTSSFLSNCLGQSIEEVSRTLNASSKFRKSIIRDSKGNPVYMLNTYWNAITDVWNAFRALNALKY